VDRDEIERQDFPAARRGYDAAAVHEHLRRVADEFEALAARPREASLAEGTSAHVRAILEAAETSARELREDAGREASDHVERVGDAARELLTKLDRLQGELDRLLGGVRSSAEGLAGSLGELSRDVGTLRGPAAAPAEPGPAESAALASAPAEPGPAESAAPADLDEPAAPAPESAAPEPSAAPAAAANGARSDDEPGARLVALNMALEGTPREQTASYLAEHYELPDVEALLDEVYASAGK
jgi:DivIVA domain-containing protein